MYFELNTELYHHGIKGQKWGQRHYQYEDGSLTAAGKARYGQLSKVSSKASIAYNKAKEKYNKADGKVRKAINAYETVDNKIRSTQDKIDRTINNVSEKITSTKEFINSEKGKKAIKVGAAVAGTALAAYGAYKFNKYVQGVNTHNATKNALKAESEFLNGREHNRLTSKLNNPLRNGYEKDSARSKFYGERADSVYNKAYNEVRNYSYSRKVKDALNAKKTSSQARKAMVKQHADARKRMLNQAKRSYNQYSQSDYDRIMRKKYRDIGLDW